MTARPDLHPAAARLTRLVEAVPDHGLGWPTPCSRYSIGDLLDHIDGFALAFAQAAAKRDVEGGPSGDAGHLGDGWQARVPTDLAAMADAWDDPEAWTGMTRAGGIDLPGEVAGVVALGELVLHGWDLAKALGEPVDYEGPGLDAVLDLVQKFQGGGAEGPFGPPVAVPSDAPLLDRVVGRSGRDPGWSSP